MWQVNELNGYILRVWARLRTKEWEFFVLTSFCDFLCFMCCFDRPVRKVENGRVLKKRREDYSQWDARGFFKLPAHGFCDGGGGSENGYEIPSIMESDRRRFEQLVWDPGSTSVGNSGAAKFSSWVVAVFSGLSSVSLDEVPIAGTSSGSLSESSMITFPNVRAINWLKF